MQMQSLSVVVPVYNEESWIGKALTAVETALRRASIPDAEIIVIDDGSKDATASVVKDLALSTPLELISQDNQGRLAARLRGLEKARGTFTLLIDSRVVIDPGSLVWLKSELERDPESVVWNAHVEMAVKGQPYARFWNAITHIAWRRYLSRPRRLSYSLEDFDLYPKGTTCFVAPTEDLRQACREFNSSVLDQRNANDDAPVIRALAAKHRIHISPEFRCTYFSRQSLGKILNHTIHRGTVFVDGYLRRGTRYFPYLVAFYLVTPLGLLLIGQPLVLAALTGTMMFAAFIMALYSRAPLLDAIVLACGLIPFALLYGIGIWKGLFLRAYANRSAKL